MISHDLGAVSTYVKTVGCLNHRLFYHNDKLITPQMIEQTYQCPIDLIAHGVPHRVFPQHSLSKQRQWLRFNFTGVTI
jgi:zinc transport system ATP-binding protein